MGYLTFVLSEVWVVAKLSTIWRSMLTFERAIYVNKVLYPYKKHTCVNLNKVERTKISRWIISDYVPCAITIVTFSTAFLLRSLISLDNINKPRTIQRACARFNFIVWQSLRNIKLETSSRASLCFRKSFHPPNNKRVKCSPFTLEYRTSWGLLFPTETFSFRSHHSKANWVSQLETVSNFATLLAGISRFKKSFIFSAHIVMKKPNTNDADYLHVKNAMLSQCGFN